MLEMYALSPRRQPRDVARDRSIEIYGPVAPQQGDARGHELLRERPHVEDRVTAKGPSRGDVRRAHRVDGPLVRTRSVNLDDDPGFRGRYRGQDPRVLDAVEAHR